MALTQNKAEIRRAMTRKEKKKQLGLKRNEEYAFSLIEVDKEGKCIGEYKSLIIKKNRKRDNEYRII